MTSKDPAPDRRTALKLCAASTLGVLAGPRVAAAPAGRLTIAGNQLLRDGMPLHLVGVAVADPIFVRKHRTVADYATLANVWQANVVRISLHPCHWRANASAAYTALTRDVLAARAAGLIVIIDWHAIGFPGGYVERPDPAWGLPRDAYESDLPLAEAFWREMAISFGSDPGVIFELWNEPVVSDRIIRSTGQFWPQLKAAWLKLIAVIRPLADNIILASGARFAHDLKGVAADLIDDERVAYAWHCYPQVDADLADRWLVSLDGLPQKKPVIVTEWGFCEGCEPAIRGTAEDFGAKFAANVLDRLGLHWTAWVWSDAAGPAMLKADGSTTDFGRFVKDQIVRSRAISLPVAPQPPVKP